jgi:SAM-dependent methyltransferase
MDALFAPVYDRYWGEINPSHRQLVTRFLALGPPAPRLLDAPCGTGKYWPLLLNAGCTVFGVDQSAGMLRRAEEKFPEVHVEKLGLQELTCENEFDGVLCIDAMENVFPDDWPPVLANFHRCLKQAGLLYLTVELPPDDVKEVFRASVGAGMPVVEGEYVKEGGYHYYPRKEQVRLWLASAGFDPVEEALGDGYHHFLMRRRQAP